MIWHALPVFNYPENSLLVFSMPKKLKYCVCWTTYRPRLWGARSPSSARNSPNFLTGVTGEGLSGTGPSAWSSVYQYSINFERWIIWKWTRGSSEFSKARQNRKREVKGHKIKKIRHVVSSNPINSTLANIRHPLEHITSTRWRAR